MSVTAQAADGTQHVFPDGTNPAVVDKVMKDYAAKSSTVGDILKSGATGLMEGTTGLAGLPGDANAMLTSGADWVRNKAGIGPTSDELAARDQMKDRSLVPSLPTSGDINEQVQKVIPYHKPETVAGQYAETIGKFAPAALSPGSAAMRAARVVVPAVTSETAGQATKGTKYEGVARLAGGLAGAAAIPAAQAAAEGVSRIAAGSGPTAAAQDVNAAGYVVPPAMASREPGIASQAMSAVSGKIKLQQAASVRNQGTTNGLAAEALGLPRDTVLSDHVLDAVRTSASQGYTAVAHSVPEIVPDAAFRADVSGLGPRIAAAAQSFPGLVNNAEITNLTDTLTNAGNFSPQAGLELVRHLRSNAAANLKAFSDPARQGLGLAQRQAAEAVDNLMDRNISAAGQPDAVNAYRDARQLLARTYDVDAATNSATGDVNARVLAALANKGRPLTGQLRAIANAGAAFPKATQVPSAFGGEERLGVLDAAAAVGSHGATIPLSIGRPVSRSILLSPTYQNMLMRAAQPMPTMRSAITDNPLAAIMSGPNAMRKENALEQAAKRAKQGGR